MLKDWLEGLEYQLEAGTLELDIHDICYNTKDVKDKSLFVCVKGTRYDGHQFIEEAIDKGAIGIVISEDVEYREGISYVRVKDTRKALAYLSRAFFDYPSQKMTVIGITGTKGKTTISYMLASILEKAHISVGIIGTIGCIIDGQFEKTNNTTPESYEIQKYMKKMVDVGCEYCILEVSSQGLKLQRVVGIDFDYGVFTNLSSDHISENEHHSFYEYMSCKKQLFQMCRIGIFNKDDQYYQDMIHDATCQIMTYSIHHPSCLQASQLSLYRKKNELGIYFKTEGIIQDYFKVNVPGEFSVYNALVAMMLSWSFDIDISYIKDALQHIHIAGRNEVIPVLANYTVIIDYAHNALAVESLLKTMFQYHPHQVICVYGVGGHRDVKRRFEIGRVAAKYEAYSVLTADNPRGEDVLDICEDIIEGINVYEGDYVVIENRKEAIIYALDYAQDDDIILCLGKGHEDYQIINQKPLPFSEKQIINDYFKK